MKVISYSLFGDPSSFEFPFYLRGLYFNARMNSLIYPDWHTFIYVEDPVYDQYSNFFNQLAEVVGVRYIETNKTATLCDAMLWRMRAIFNHDFSVTHVICRDADAITTYKEAQAVQEWIDSGLGFHGITDNPAHSLPMMGGMVGFKVDHFRATFPQWKTFNDMIKGVDLRQRGSDQDLMMKKIYPFVKHDMVGHFFDGCRENVKITKHTVSKQIPGVDSKLWESNLTCRHIGSPGVVDFETLRFFQRFDKTDYSEFEREFKDICYWAK